MGEPTVVKGLPTKIQSEPGRKLPEGDFVDHRLKDMGVLHPQVDVQVFGQTGDPLCGASRTGCNIDILQLDGHLSFVQEVRARPDTDRVSLLPSVSVSPRVSPDTPAYKE